MPTRIAFSTHYPDRMKELAGKPTRFPEKIVAGLRFAPGSIIWDDYPISERICFGLTPKTTTIRSNYEYWKSKEGQLIQPFFWAGKPYRSKQVVFCPEVRLTKVSRIKISHNNQIKRDSGLVLDKSHVWIDGGHSSCIWKNGEIANCAFTIEQLTQTEGFDHPDHFWMWFNRDFSGAYLELENAQT